MPSITSDPADQSLSEELDYQVLIIGAGVCGLYQLHRLMQMGVNVIALDANPDLGGTWYRNRYPGCRFDSESYTYGYSFSKEVLNEWSWSERFAARPETLSYLNFVANKYGLRQRIRFNSTVVGADFEPEANRWIVRLEDGSRLSTRFLLTAIGLLSVPAMPKIPGADAFEGESFHTFYWPQDDVELEGKRVGVIGTGASGVQVISTIASQVKELVVFQRRPNWCAPLVNGPINDEEMERIRRHYDEIFDRCRQSPSGFLHAPSPQRTLEVPEEERLAFWEKLYYSPGFGIWLGNYRDTLMREEPNRALSDFIAGKIRQRVKDPEVAEKLIPADHGFGTRRVPLETNYFEAYNLPHVHLVALKESPIERITQSGIQTSNNRYPLDLIVYATGFDAITGAFDRIDFRGLKGERLRDRWVNGPVTSFGVSVTGFPNLFMLVGPQGGSVAANIPRAIEEVVDWTTAFIDHLIQHGYTRVEATSEAEWDWQEHVAEMAQKMLLSKGKSWLTGYNPNVRPEVNSPRLLIYTGGADRYRECLATEASEGYPSFHIA